MLLLFPNCIGDSKLALLPRVSLNPEKLDDNDNNINDYNNDYIIY